MRVSLVGKPTTVDCSAEHELLRKLKKCGKYHHLFYRFSITKAMFGIEPPTWISTDRVRFSSPGSILAGDVVEIYECVPAEFHSLFRTNVSEAVAEVCSFLLLCFSN